MGKFTAKKLNNVFINFKLIINLRETKLFYSIINWARKAAKRKRQNNQKFIVIPKYLKTTGSPKSLQKGCTSPIK